MKPEEQQQIDRQFEDIKRFTSSTEMELNKLKQDFEKSQSILTSNNSRRTIENLTLYPVTHVLKNTEPQTLANYSTFFNCSEDYVLNSVAISYTTAGSSATLNIQKLTGTQAPGSGVNLLNTGFNVNATANTTYFPRLDKTDNIYLRAGNRICLTISTTPSSIQNLVVTIYLQIP